MATIPEIFDLLEAGEKLELYFFDEREAETFRQSLVRYKMKHDAILESLDGSQRETSLSFKLFQIDDPIPDGPSLSATVCLKARPLAKQYDITIISKKGGSDA